MNCLSGMARSMSIGRYSKPCASVGTAYRAGLSLPVLASSVRPTISTVSAWSTPEMNTLLPDSSQSAPSRRAVVVSLCEFDPASDSVIANAMIIEPSAMPGSQRSFCASVPKRVMIVPQMAGETTIISSVHPAADSSSSTSESS